MSLMVRVPVTPASDGNWFWNSMRIVGTSRTHTVPAAPKVNVSGSVVLVVVVGPVVVVEEEVVVTAVDVGAAVVDVPGAVVDVVVDVGDVVVVDDVLVEGVVVLVDVVVSSGGQFSGSSTTAVAVSPELA
jgi:cytoskeletal protein CcmA (bactofilin family)